MVELDRVMTEIELLLSQNEQEAFEIDTGFDFDTAQRLKHMEENHFWFKSRMKIIEWVLKRHKLLNSSHSFCELGSGNGFVSFNLSKYFKKTTSVEGQMESLRILLERYQKSKTKQYKYRLINASIESFSPDETYDLLGMFDVIEHISPDKLPETFVKLKNMMKPGAKLIITVPALQSLWSQIDVIGKHYQRFSKETLVELLEKNGFKIMYSSYFMFSTLPFLFIQRFLADKKFGNNTEHKDLLDDGVKISPVLNSIFENLCNLDFLIMLIFNKLPIGSSLVCISEIKK